MPSSSGQVSWLAGLPTLFAFPAIEASGRHKDFVAAYSCGAAPDFNGIPFYHIYVTRYGGTDVAVKRK